MVTKTILYEPVTTLSTDEFNECSKKTLISQRGNSSVIYSNGETNFVKSDNQLKQLKNNWECRVYIKFPLHECNAVEINSSCKERFIGGSVRKAKEHLEWTVENAMLTFWKMCNSSSANGRRNFYFRPFNVFNNWSNYRSFLLDRSLFCFFETVSHRSNKIAYTFTNNFFKCTNNFRGVG